MGTYQYFFLFQNTLMVKSRRLKGHFIMDYLYICRLSEQPLKASIRSIDPKKA